MYYDFILSAPFFPNVNHIRQLIKYVNLTSSRLETNTLVVKVNLLPYSMLETAERDNREGPEVAKFHLGRDYDLGAAKFWMERAEKSTQRWVQRWSMKRRRLANETYHC